MIPDSGRPPEPLLSEPPRRSVCPLKLLLEMRFAGGCAVFHLRQVSIPVMDLAVPDHLFIVNALVLPDSSAVHGILHQVPGAGEGVPGVIR